MNNTQKLGLLGSAGLAAGLGAGLMYLLDPQAGGRRRALARDQAVHGLKKGGVAAGKTARDLANRTRGLVAETGSKLHHEQVDDQVLSDRVRSKMGRLVSHPSAIEVAAQDGCVILSGPVLAEEVDKLLAKVHSVRGVREVENRLEVHESAGNISALQGEGRTARPLWQRNWAPTTRLLAGTAGGALAVAGLARRDKLGAVLGAVGLGLLARGLKNRTEGLGRSHHEKENLAGAGHGLTSRRGTQDLSAAGFEGGLGQLERELQTTLP
jgi:hypothetical protein